MKYVNKNDVPPTTSLLAEYSMKKILVNNGYQETDINNNEYIDICGYVAVSDISDIRPTETSLLVADKNESGNWFIKWEEKDTFDTKKDVQVTGNIVRKQRNKLLAQSDWTQGKDISNTVSTAWTTYRQELRDVTQQPNFPYGIVWPTPPQ